MSKNIVVLSGSPRRGGNTDILADAFIEGAKSAGKNVTVFRVAEMKIAGCTGCEHCFKEVGVCAIKDDMVQILEALRKADVLVLASPVYHFAVTAQLKLALDRQYALFNEKTPIKRTVLLMPCADDDPRTADGAVAMYKTWLSYTNWEDAGIIIVTGVHEPGAIKGNEGLLKAKALGGSI